MDRRKKYVCVLDTETCNGIVVDDKLDLSCSLVYDLGWQIIDLQGNVYERKSFAIADVFCDMADVMQSAYYANKIPKYWEDIKNGSRKLRTFWNVRKELFEDMAKYNCTIVSAHNARFDYNALNNTIRYISKSANRYFLPYGTEVWDTMKMAQNTYAKEKMYICYCIANDFMTKHKTPRPRITAEILYRYITGNYDFVEEHQGLADVEIESELLVAMLRKGVSLANRRLWND